MIRRWDSTQLTHFILWMWHLHASSPASNVQQQRDYKTSSLQPASTRMYSCPIVALLPFEKFVSSTCNHPFFGLLHPQIKLYLVGETMRGLSTLLTHSPTSTLGGKLLLWFVAPCVHWCGYFEQWNIYLGIDLPLPNLSICPCNCYLQSVISPSQN